MNIEFTEKEKAFLKEFANKHYEGSEHNLCTPTPLHVVEQTYYRYKDYDSTIEDDEQELVIIDETDECYIRTNIKDFIKEYLNDKREIDDCFNVSLNETNLDVTEIEDKIDSFCKENNINVEYKICYRVPYFVPVAYFLIRDEALRYLEYQSYNLHNPRVYTYSLGYSNGGDLPIFYNLLQRIGKGLIDNE